MFLNTSLYFLGHLNSVLQIIMGHSCGWEGTSVTIKCEVMIVYGYGWMFT